MDFNIDSWMKVYLEELKSLFDSELLFVGIQGSYGRGRSNGQQRY